MGTQRRKLSVDPAIEKIVAAVNEVEIKEREDALVARSRGTTRRKMAPVAGASGIQILEEFPAQAETPREELEKLRDNALEAHMDALEALDSAVVVPDEECGPGCGHENPLPIGEAVVDDPNLDSTDGAHPAWWRGQDHFAAVFKQDFGVDYIEGRRIWKLFHQPGVMAALKLAVDLVKNPPEVEVEGREAFKELRAELRTQMLSSVDDIAEKVKQELIGADECEELVMTDEDIPELKEKLDDAKDEAIKVVKREVADLRNAVSKTIDEAESTFKDDIIQAELGDEARNFNSPDVIGQAEAVILYLRGAAGEL